MMSDSPIQYFVVDAFTNRLFSGNPAAIVPLRQWPDDAWLQNVAMEMNLSETAYLVPQEQGYRLRWFTPKAEVDLCGHATIASAVVLAHLGKLSDGSSVQFLTRSGVLGAQRQGSQILLDFPALTAEPSEPPAGLLESLEMKARSIGRSKFDFLIEAESESAVRKVAPDFKQLAKVKCRGVIVTARSDDRQFDFVSRFFAPAVGVDEDPVTGSAHCLLAPYWGARLGKSAMLACQASRRGGVVRVEVSGQRVILGGEGVIFAKGEIAGGGVR